MSKSSEMQEPVYRKGMSPEEILEHERKLKEYQRKRREEREDPTRDMSGHGFVKELTWERCIQLRDDDYEHWVIRTYDFFAHKIPCSCVNSSEFVWLAPQRNGIYMVCCNCNTATGPLSMERGEFIDERKATGLEVFDILTKRGQTVPIKLANLVKRQRVRRKTSRHRPTRKY